MAEFPIFDYDFSEITDEELIELEINEAGEIHTIATETDVTDKPIEGEKPGRFPNLTESEVDEILTKSEAKHTKENTKWGVGVFEGNTRILLIRYFKIDFFSVITSNKRNRTKLLVA